MYNRKNRAFSINISIIAHIFFIVKEIKIIKMKICAIICEYNPFHNGHLYQLCEAKRLSGADAVICVMSGNFVQRGEAAIMNKYVRAKHAVLAGADVVLELPTVFATSNAELFAKGGVYILNSIPDVKNICFGAENANKTAFVSAARYLNDEPKEVSEKIKAYTASGDSYAKARAKAWAGFIPLDLLSSPNNILGLEYTKALLSSNSHISILPIERVGQGYKADVVEENFSSATAIRAAIQNGADFKNNLPEFVRQDLPEKLENSLDSLEKYAVLNASLEELKSICDCTEGLENAFKKAALSNESLVSSLTSPRYTSARIRRIALQNLLKIDEKLIRECLQAPLYLRVLAANRESKEVLLALSKASFPVLTRGAEAQTLSGIAKRCYEKDSFAEQIHTLLYGEVTNRKIFI